MHSNNMWGEKRGVGAEERVRCTVRSFVLGEENLRTKSYLCVCVVCDGGLKRWA